MAEHIVNKEGHKVFKVRPMKGCGVHHPYATREQAEAKLQDMLASPDCTGKERLNVFEHEDHFHVGHVKANWFELRKEHHNGLSRVSQSMSG